MSEITIDKLYLRLEGAGTDSVEANFGSNRSLTAFLLSLIHILFDNVSSSPSDCLTNECGVFGLIIRRQAMVWSLIRS